MSDKVTRDEVNSAFISLNDDILCTIGSNLDFYLYSLNKNAILASKLGLLDNVDDIILFAKLIRLYLEDTDELESEKELCQIN